jgi:hypothetical protein
VEESVSVIRFITYANPDLLTLYNKDNLQNTIKSIKTSNTTDMDILQNIKKNIENNPDEKDETHIPEFVLKEFVKCQDNPDCFKYLKSRGYDYFKDVFDDFWFSKNKFFIYNDKKVFLKDYLIIPIYTKIKEKYGWGGFYSRCITEKKFSTFILQNTDKFWVSNPKLILGENLKNIELITEGIFDALSSGFKNTGAMISADIPESIIDKLSENCILAFDNDKTGIQKAIKYSKHKKNFRIFVPNEDQEKDFNELLKEKTPEEIKEYILQNTYKGVQAETRLRMKSL